MYRYFSSIQYLAWVYFYRRMITETNNVMEFKNQDAFQTGVNKVLFSKLSMQNFQGHFEK